ncbi:GPI ethanolamine phosphate transferase 2 isoform X2 [Tripterygium wilfordii]|uniref:GPI ethanolamine phosphate transferase 2 isoform X2 n=1 Tax=Tripterygium wilfordii TaxID=458696 RepID=UPI0018F7EC1A|nr:GPI ethanolamine phosphate transferase 2 isoform X2 [Tripterygium wilfordii]
MPSITCAKLTSYTVGAVVLQMIGLSLFVFGFFPVKPSLSGFSGADSFRPPGYDSSDNQNESSLTPDQLRLLYQGLSGIPPLFDRLILMVVDGLPAEFVLGKDRQPPSKAMMESMSYTQSLLANGMAIGYHAKAAPPTVTMPRLKAMVSGAIGGFLDVAFNFNTQALLDDNLLDQFFRIGWKMVMLGDETWLRLFPGLFIRQDGVSSFYVKDTIQVDHNVSRHLGDELRRDDWSLLVLHYLGLDHVGHIGGRNSALMAPKLAEMDDVVKMIHLSAIQRQKNNEGRTLLVVVSDHGMTENGNHGGSSYEETDSLALFVGLNSHMHDQASTTRNSAYQVDIAPTLALLFGVPIPKNNVGILISKAFESLADEDQLRAMELNAWQLIRLLQAQLPGLSCANLSRKAFSDSHESRTARCRGRMEKMLCCLYMNAAVFHSSWKSKKASRSNSREEYSSTVAAYYEFMKSARKHTQNSMLWWCSDEFFIVGSILILILSMGSSSMVEEEQYIWHFMTSTFYLILLRKTLKSFAVGNMRNLFGFFKCQNGRTGIRLCSIFVTLVSGRILRGWHQGGVNWTDLPDISKWLEQYGSDSVRLIQLTSGLLIICLGLLALSSIELKRRVVKLVGFSFLIPGLLVLWHIVSSQEIKFASSADNATSLAQMIYATLGMITFGSVMSIPWLMPIRILDKCTKHDANLSTLALVNIQDKYPLVEFRDSSYVIGLVYLLCWCLLQLLLQQPINSMPIFLLLVQILVSMIYSSNSWRQPKEWVEVAAFYCLGMAGHFALGNSNSLATIDVAGAFIGLSSYSTLISGILMFIITYASPMFALLSIVMYISVKKTSHLVEFEIADSGYLLKMMLGLPCLVPLGLNSIILVAYTIVLLLMRNHLFVWSVFSPKYLYVCATTVCVYVGVFVVAATEIYVYLVLNLRRKKQVLICNGAR